MSPKLKDNVGFQKYANNLLVFGNDFSLINKGSQNGLHEGKILRKHLGCPEVAEMYFVREDVLYVIRSKMKTDHKN